MASGLNAHHEMELLNFIETIVEVGAATVTGSKLRIWFDQERVTVTIWRTIRDLWRDVLERSRFVLPSQKNTPLFVGDLDGGGYTFIWGEGLTVGKDSWFEDIDTWC